jgi:hypothetical protein
MEPLREASTPVCLPSICLLIPIASDFSKIRPSYLIVDDCKYLGPTVGKQPTWPLTAFILINGVW